MPSHALLDLIEQVVDLAAYGAHINLGIKQSCRTNDLFHVVLRDAQLIVARRGRHIDELRNPRLELVKAQRTVVQGRGQTEPVLDQRNFTRAVAFVHAANLRDRHMALIYDAQHVLGEVIDQGERGLAGASPVKMARVVLDTRAEPHGLEHLKVVIGTLLQALRLQQLVLGLELGHALFAFFLDSLECSSDLGLLGHIMRGGPNGHGVVLAQQLSSHLVDLGYELDLVTKELKAQRMLRIRRIDVDDIPSHAKCPTRQVVIVAIVLDVNQRMDKVIPLKRNLLVHIGRQACIILGAADTINARDARHHDHIAARKQRCRRLVPQHLHFLVDGRVLLDVRIALRHVCLGLIVVVVRDKIDHGVVGEKLLQLAGELCGQGLVGRHDKRRLAHGLDGLCHREGLARTGDAKQHLKPVSVLNALHKRPYGLRLVPRGLIGRNNVKLGLRARSAKSFKLSAYTLDLKLAHRTTPCKHN